MPKGGKLEEPEDHLARVGMLSRRAAFASLIA